jgi:hypothetical protein
LFTKKGSSFWKALHSFTLHEAYLRGEAYKINVDQNRNKTETINITLLSICLFFFDSLNDFLWDRIFQLSYFLYVECICLITHKHTKQSSSFLTTWWNRTPSFEEYNTKVELWKKIEKENLQESPEL